jgi:SNF2 family DNA or RNA helicase
VGTSAERETALRKKADIYMINFELLPWLVERCGTEWLFGMVIIDESSKVKSLRATLRTNPSGKTWVQGQGGSRAKALLKALVRNRTERIVELTGTPAPNGLQDLWGPTYLLDRGQRLGRIFDAFYNRWFRSDFNGWGMIPMPHAKSEIESALKDICLSIRSEDHFPVEKPIVQKIEVELPEEAKKQYRELEKVLYTEIQAEPIEAASAGAKIAKLRQLANGAAYLGSADDPGEREWVPVHEAKLDCLEEIVEEAAGENVLVSYTLKSDLARILKRFPKARELDQKPKTLVDWNKGLIPILLVHPQSAGHGISLQWGGRILVHFSWDFSLEAHIQVAERIGPVRQAQSGLNRTVFIHYIVAKDTVDTDMLDVLENKGSVQDSLLRGMRRRHESL